MSAWDIRQAIESAIPAEVYVVIIVLAVALIAWARFVRKGPRR
jgi:hypothetical protein